MKRYLSLAFAIFFSILTHAQGYTYTLNGNPINTTGWLLGGSATNNVTDIKITQAATSQNGYVYYSVPEDLSSACAYFTVEFDFKIITTPGVEAADGLAFWFINNPPTAFGLGGSIGLPANMTGFGLIFDVYSNDNNVTPQNNPLISLRQFTNNGYTEGNSTGLIGSEVYNQTSLIDGSWHHCLLVYQSGTMNVYLDNSPTSIISGNITLTNTTGYFGFSASTGAFYEEHYVKNVIISGGQVPPNLAEQDINYCQDEVATELTVNNTITNGVLHWYTQQSGGTELSATPTPSTATPGTTIWYVTQSAPGCNLESDRVPVRVHVYDLPDLTINPPDAEICKGNSIMLQTTGAPNVTWSPATALSNITGTSTTSTPLSNITYTAVGTSVNGCVDTATVTITVHPSDSIYINATINEGEVYVFGEQSLNLPGEYKKHFMSQWGCDSLVIVNLTINYRDKEVMFPTAFTPNGDGRNDKFAPKINYPDLVNVDIFVIYNRWGQLVFSGYGINALKGWDGTYGGKPAEMGVYYYYSKIKGKGIDKEFKGDVTLFR